MDRTEVLTKIGAALRRLNAVVATAESCTGGLIGAALTELPGSSDFYAGGFVVYSNELKTKLLGAPKSLLNEKGAVSGETAQAMAEGALKKTGADWAIAVTGIAGPDGGSSVKPVGLVYSCIASRDGVQIFRDIFSGDRAAVRESTVSMSLARLLVTLEEGKV